VDTSWNLEISTEQRDRLFRNRNRVPSACARGIGGIRPVEAGESSKGHLS